MIKRIRNIKSGILLALISTFTFSIMGVFTKLASQTVPVAEIVFARSFISFVIIFFYMRAHKLPLCSGNIKPLFIRGLLGSVALLLSFYAISRLKLSEAIILFQTSPIFVVIFAQFFLKEKLPKLSFLLIFISIFGVALVVKPELRNFDGIPAFAAFVSAIITGLAYVYIRLLKREHSTQTIVLYFAFTAMLVSGPFIIYEPILPSFKELIYLLIIGFCATFAQLVMTKAFGLERAGLVSIVTYTGVFFSMFWDFIIWGVILDKWALFGGALIIISSAFLTLRTYSASKKVLH